LAVSAKAVIERRIQGYPENIYEMSGSPAEGDADHVARARIISTALPYMLRYEGKIVVVKYGGSAMGDPELAKTFARDITLIETSGMLPVVVHGGGPQIGRLLKDLGINSEFRGGLRVTDKRTVEVVEMVLAGTINKEIVMAINAEGGKAVGLCGKDGNMVIARKLSRREIDPQSNIERIVDLGFVGEPETVNRGVIDMVSQAGLIPVIAPVAPGREGATYNINADTFAGAIAGALNATRLLFLTDVQGVLDRDGKLIKQLTADEARAMIRSGVIAGGMIPKVETCIEALEHGVEGVVILNGATPHAVLLELFTELGAGTLITK
jgi:acetylglutamate kinase